MATHPRRRARACWPSHAACSASRAASCSSTRCYRAATAACAYACVCRMCVHGLPPRCERSIAKVPSLVIRSLVSVRPPNAPEAHPPLARGESLGPRGAPAPRGCWSEGWSEGCGSAARPESSVPSQCHHFRPPLTVQATGRIPSSARRGATVPGSRTRPSARPCARSTPLSPPRCPAWRDTSPAGPAGTVEVPSWRCHSLRPRPLETQGLGPEPLHALGSSTSADQSPAAVDDAAFSERSVCATPLSLFCDCPSRSVTLTAARRL